MKILRSESCLVCSSNTFVRSDLMLLHSDIRFLECEECSFVYVTEIDSDLESQQISHFWGSLVEDLPKLNQQRYWAKARLLAQISGYIRRYRILDPLKKVSILDFGGGTAFVFDYLVQNNLIGSDSECCLLESAKELKEFAVVRGYSVIDALELNLKSNQQKFDLIVSLEVHEHLQFPLETMDSLSRALKPEGYLIIEVPLAPFQILKSRIELFFRGYTHGLVPWLHYNHFNVSSMKKLVEVSGLEVVGIFPVNFHMSRNKRFNYNTRGWNLARKFMGVIFLFLSKIGVIFSPSFVTVARKKA